MKFLAILSLLFAVPAQAAGPQTLEQIAVGADLDAASVRLAAVGDRTLVAVQPLEQDQRGALWYGVEPGMDARSARVVWSTRLACPLAGGPGEVVATATLVLCRTDHDVFALSAADGTVRWRFHHDRPLNALHPAGARLAIDVDGEELVALEAASGRTLARYALGGAPLRAAAMTPDGPLAFVVHKADAARPGHTHAIAAQPLAADSPTPDVREAMKPLWRKPFGGADYRLVPSEDMLLATPMPGVLDARELTTGTVRWLDPTPLLPTLEALPGGLAVGGIRPDGVRWVGLARARTQVRRWRQAWTHGALQGVGEDNGHLVWLGETGWLVTRVSDGSVEARGDLAEDTLVAAVQAADHAVTLLLWQPRSGATWLHVPLTTTQPPAALPAAPALDWLEPGRELAWLDYAHGGRDPETGLPGDGPMQELVVWPLAASEDALRFAFRRRTVGIAEVRGERVLAATARAEGHRLDLTLDAGTAVWADRTALLVAGQTWRALAAGNEVDLAVGDERVQRFVRLGSGSTRLQVADKAGVLRWADVDAEIATNGAGDVRLWLVPMGEEALVVRAELPRQTWALMQVRRGAPEVEPPTGAPHSARKPGKTPKKPRKSHKG